MMFIRRRVAGLLAATALLSACKVTTIEVLPVASVHLDQPAPSINSGTSVQLTAIPLSSGNTILTGRTFTWSSSDVAIATVNQSGLVQGVGAGKATITATSENVSGTALVTVQSVVGK